MENATLMKALLIGDESAGKTSFMLKLVENKFNETYRPTIGVEFMTFLLPEQNVKIQLWDSAGSQRFKAITKAYYRGVTLFLICFDVNNREHFNNLPNYLKEIEDHSSGNFETLLIGNKNDLGNRQVSITEAENFALSHGFFYMDTSSKLEDTIVLRNKVNEIVNKMKITGFDHYGIGLKA